MINMCNILRKTMLFAMVLVASTALSQNKIYHVSPASKGTGDGSSWDNATTLAKALDQAAAGDQIWVQGFEQITDTSQLYIPDTADGFTLESGVKLYGGFQGTEVNIADRQTLGKPYQLKYRSVLSGDIERNDVVDNTNLIFPANTTRQDNATHVLTLNMAPSSGGNNNGYPTVVNGFTIIGGHADGSGEYGGGIYITGDNTQTGGGVYKVERCFFVNNYATQGGAVYVDDGVKNVSNNTSLINQCVVYNNAAGERSAVENKAGGIYLAGEGTVVNTSIFNNENGGVKLSSGSRMVNCTVARNTGSGIDMIEADVSVYTVFNSIVGGNTTLSTSDSYRPKFKNSAFHEAVAGDKDGNIYVSKENRGENAPLFEAPSIKTSFDRDFDWRKTAYPLWSWNVQEGSVVIDKGNGGSYSSTTFGSEDMAGNARVKGTIDIGAYEYQPIDASRIRYVMPTVKGTGDGSSWDNASNDLQKMIDELAAGGTSAAEVWVAAGTYTPKSQLVSGTAYSASFRMRDGVSVYGGFAGGESSKLDRDREKGTMPWDFTYETILEGSYYDHSDFAWTGKKWTLTGDSRHVVWFAPMAGEDEFSNVTTLDGVTIMGGYAQGGTGLEDFKTDNGAGVYMDGANTYVSNCIIKENYASGNGGGVYLKAGRVQSSLIYNNNADSDGGAVYVENSGLVLRCMLANNSAHNGAGVYLFNAEDVYDDHPEYLILSTCVISNNTATGNGAVYCGRGGVLMQNTITNNQCVTATDATDVNASQTGGVYIDEYALVVNSVIWNNMMGSINIPIYARNPSSSSVRFMYNAISGVNNAVWNNTLQEQTLSLVDTNGGTKDDGTSIGPRFVEPGDMGISGFDLEKDFGVQEDWKDVKINYYWKPVDGSNLWARGMALGLLPDDVVLAPEVDIEGSVFAQKPAIGAFSVDATTIVPDETDNALIVYVDVECTEPDHNGQTWATAYRSLNNAISYLAGLDENTVGSKRLEVHVLEGDIWPRYAFTNNDPKTATITVPKTLSGEPIYLYGGYHRDESDETNNTVERAPLTYRSVINGNTEANDIADGLYHCITVEQGAKLVLDGFHVINGYAAGEASRRYGAGLLAHAGSEVTVKNCIFENNTADEGAAIDAREATLTMENCVVNNNTNTTETASVINAQTLTMNHVTVANNYGAAPAVMGTSSLSVGNKSGTNNLSLASVGAKGAKNFANPTNGVGATLGFDTYLGGYSEFRPLTSSTEAGNTIINKSTGKENLTVDINGNERNLGGVPDLGAYEADLPESGRVIYVRVGGSGDGLSWGNAMGDINDAVQKGLEYNNNLSDTEKLDADKRAQVWVAAGTYSHNPESGDPSCFVIEEGVDVYGGFPAVGVPGFSDRKPLVSTSIYSQDAEGNKMNDEEIEKYETILQPLTSVVSNSDRGSYNVNRRVLSQRDEYNPHELGDTYTYKNPNYETNYFYNGRFDVMTSWDGFTIQNGFLNIGDARDDGGAGARIYENVTLKNCIVQNNENYQRGTGEESSDSRAGGIYSYGGTLINCYIQNNKLGRTNSTNYGSSACYGAGVYLSYGTLYNCVIADNIVYAGYADGGGILIECGEFYNNTVINNIAKGNNRASGGLRVWVGTTMKDAGFSGTVKIYNSIIYGNSGFAGVTGNSNLAMSNSRVEVWGTLVDHTNLNVDLEENWDKTADGIYLDEVTCPKVSDYDWNNMFVDYQNRNYRLNSISKAINMATNTMDVVRILPPTPNGWLRFVSYNYNVSGSWYYNGKYYKAETSKSLQSPGYGWRRAVISLVKGDNFFEDDVFIDLFDYTDMDFTDRIKDCTIDAGAYELENIENTTPNVDADNKTAIYYVTQNGSGTASGNSFENAACAMKLQTVLNAAGIYKQTNPDYTVTVKVAGYNTNFVYHANTLTDENDPQSYSYTIPYGVILEGGYSDTDDDWSDEGSRDIINNKTILSAIKSATATLQEINGYHTVTFGEKPDGWTGGDEQTIIDGVWLTDGSATSMAGAGNPKTMGGGAIVPSGAHVRNCVVMNCEAIQGGGLYVMPGGIVSGTAVLRNTAEEGGGIYADNTDVSADNRAHILSCTIAENEASSAGGGLYMEDGAVMNVNTVIFGNTSGSDKNVSGVVNIPFYDNKLSGIYGITDKSFYPFNNCFVETQEMPSDFENAMLESDKSLYFTGDYYLLRDYSLLIKHGIKNAYQEKLVSTFNVAENDMQNIKRIQEYNASERIDAGAFAYEGGILPTELFTRIFVSQTANVTLSDGENMMGYLGRSFYTSFSTLEDALGYIRLMREDYPDKKFEVLVAEGTYKPTYERSTNAEVVHDQRLYSFVVPQGVSIYGGFSGNENYSSGGIKSIPVKDGNNIVVEDMGDINDILSARDYSDFNQNNVYEPWELANQTILSGQINASADAQNAYHVVFTQVDEEATTVNPVVLNGLTVMYGQTYDELSYSTKEDEQGRGGGIYSNGVTYTISRCRLLNNIAVRGGAVFVRDADLNLSGCILAGNKTIENKAGSTNNLTSRGGAAYVSSIDKLVNLRAANTLWANNESAGEGGAIGANSNEELVGVRVPGQCIDIMNNTFVRNKASVNPVLYVNDNTKSSKIVNSVIWGNQSDKFEDDASVAGISYISHSASDEDYGRFSTNDNSNILLENDNMGKIGPRFTNPSTVAGVAGNSSSSLWNPVAISVLTDSGDGTEHTSNKPDGEEESEHEVGQITGAYKKWFTDNSDVAEEYFISPISGTKYYRYSGPNNEDSQPLCKSIDMGVYEYQYVSNFSTMTAIYVDTISHGTGSGSTWANATDDLRGAIVGAANPAKEDGDRVIYVRDGNYSWPRTSAGTAYMLNINDNPGVSSYNKVTLKGSCTGSGEQQDFSKPTVLRNDGETNILMSVSANNKDVVFEGFTFINKTGIGVDASTGTDGSLTLKNCGFRTNETGLNIAPNSDKMLVYNTLFADGGTGLSGANENTTVVNATFANNTVDMTFVPDISNKNVYNSVSWNNKTYNLPDDETSYNNKKIEITAGGDASANNSDLQHGPNFVDPLNNNLELRDYHIRPSVKLLNKGSNDLYVNNVVKVVGDPDSTAIPSTEVDLGNNARLVDNAIDVGAYEYEAPLQQIVYVKADLTGTADGKSWETALGDLQGAVDLAGLYALNHKDDPDNNGYVFVHGNYHDTGTLNLTLRNTKVYGSMNDELSSESDNSQIVEDLLAKRKGLLEATNRSSVENVAINADGVIDGFVVAGTANVNGGVLSTSIVENDVTGNVNGLLYNSLVLGDGTTAHPGDVSGVKAVNVTASGSMDDAGAGSGNNRSSAEGDNTYVTDNYWNYQLMETSKDIDLDPSGDRIDISGYMKKVGHERDLIGNKRIRNIVDNGCFETWNICERMTTDNVITSTDYPIGKSVVYVRKEQELKIQKIQNADGNTLVYKDESSAFNPGFLLLEHHAGLRGCGNYIRLTNLAAEYDISKNSAELVAMPFYIDSKRSVLRDLTPKRYDGNKRAAYDYRYDGNNGVAWTELNSIGEAGVCEGLLFENSTADDLTLRFYGRSEEQYVYSEDGSDKTISLNKYNFNEAWTTDADGNIVPSTSNRFTHKENMSWNLFGSPYLCAMNYSDLEYGRVLYGYDNYNRYRSVKTYGDDGTTVAGYIPRGSAVFTQSATLKDNEIFSVKQPDGSINGSAFGSKSRLSIVLHGAGATRGVSDVKADVLQLETVEPENARTDFDINADGVKWFACVDSMPLIYAEQGSGRYSLLSAVNNEGVLALGVTLYDAGAYVIALDENSDVSDYDAVTLTDKVAGKTVNLKDGGYEFTAVEGGDVTDRFTLRFTSIGEGDDEGIRIVASGDGKAEVYGVDAGDVVCIYDTAGRLVARRMCSGDGEKFTLKKGVFVFQADRNERGRSTKKYMVK